MLQRMIYSIIADWKYHKASFKIKNKEYKNAINIYYDILELNKKMQNKSSDSLIAFDIGYCYYNLNLFNEAKFWFSLSFKEFKKDKMDLNFEPYYYLLVYYGTILNRAGNNKEIKEIYHEAKQIFSIDLKKHFDNNLVIPSYMELDNSRVIKNYKSVK